MKNQTTEMTATVVNNQVQITVENYREQLDVPTISTIDNLIADNYYINDMIDFINEHGAANFFNYYEDYVAQSEKFCYKAVDAFVEEFGIGCIENFEDSYQGQYNSPGQFAESFYDDIGYQIPEYIVVDWNETYEEHLESSFEYVDGFVFNKNF